VSGFRFEWRGLRELQAALRALPRELGDDARDIVLDHAHQAEHEVKANYAAHSRTSTLGDSVEVRIQFTGTYGAAAMVIATAKHATWFEHGTALRHTSQGWRRGVMPPVPPMHQFVPVMERRRRAMYVELTALLRRAGLLVEGGGG
jgi:hypothetical protein